MTSDSTSQYVTAVVRELGVDGSLTASGCEFVVNRPNDEVDAVYVSIEDAEWTVRIARLGTLPDGKGFRYYDDGWHARSGIKAPNYMGPGYVIPEPSTVADWVAQLVWRIW